MSVRPLVGSVDPRHLLVAVHRLSDGSFGRPPWANSPCRGETTDSTPLVGSSGAKSDATAPRPVHSGPARYDVGPGLDVLCADPFCRSRGLNAPCRAGRATSDLRLARCVVCGPLSGPVVHCHDPCPGPFDRDRCGKSWNERRRRRSVAVSRTSEREKGNAPFCGRVKRSRVKGSDRGCGWCLRVCSGDCVCDVMRADFGGERQRRVGQFVEVFKSELRPACQLVRDLPHKRRLLESRGTR